MTTLQIVTMSFVDNLDLFLMRYGIYGLDKTKNWVSSY